MLDEYKDVVIDFDRTETSYIRFYMKAIPGHIKLSEIEAYDTGTLVTPGETVVKPDVNLAAGATVIYSSAISDQSWSPALLVNGIIEESGGFTTQNVLSGYVGFKFDNPTVVNTLTLYSASVSVDDSGYWSGIPEGFKVEYSMNGLNWTEISDIRLAEIPSGQEAVEVSFETVVAKYIRVNSDLLYPKPSDSGRTYIQLAEMEVSYDPYKLGCYDGFKAYYQEKDNGSTNDLRVVVAISEKNLSEIGVGFKMKITFTLADGSSKSTEGVFGENYMLYRSVNAGTDTYYAADGSALFGCVITDIPDGAYNSVSIQITNESGSVVFSATK